MIIIRIMLFVLISALILIAIALLLCASMTKLVSATVAIIDFTIQFIASSCIRLAAAIMDWIGNVLHRPDLNSFAKSLRKDLL